MLLQTNSYIVPKERRAEHARLIRRFRQAMARIGCDQFEVYEQVGANWSPGGANGRYVQIMKFRDRQHQQAVQAAERNDPGAQQIIAEFCELINFSYQQQHSYFATGFYTSVIPIGPRQEVDVEADGDEPSSEEEEEPDAAGAPRNAVEEIDLAEPEPEPVAAVPVNAPVPQAVSEKQSAPVIDAPSPGPSDEERRLFEDLAIAPVRLLKAEHEALTAPPPEEAGIATFPEPNLAQTSAQESPAGVVVEETVAVDVAPIATQATPPSAPPTAIENTTIATLVEAEGDLAELTVDEGLEFEDDVESGDLSASQSASSSEQFDLSGFPRFAPSSSQREPDSDLLPPEDFSLSMSHEDESADSLLDDARLLENVPRSLDEEAAAVPEAAGVHGIDNRGKDYDVLEFEAFVRELEDPATNQARKAL